MTESPLPNEFVPPQVTTAPVQPLSAAVAHSIMPTWGWFVVIGIVVIGGGVIFITQQQSASPAVSTSQSPAATTSTPASSQPAAVTALSQTYTNTAYHYQIKYPTDWTAHSNGGPSLLPANATSQWVTLQPQSCFATTGSSQSCGASVDVEIDTDIDSTRPIIEEAQSLYKDDPAATRTIVTFAGQSAAILQHADQYAGETVYYLRRPGDASNLYTLTASKNLMSALKNDVHAKQALDILQTFSFTQ